MLVIGPLYILGRAICNLYNILGGTTYHGNKMYTTNMYSMKMCGNKIQGEQNSWVESTESKVQTTQFRGNNEAFTQSNYGNKVN